MQQAASELEQDRKNRLAGLADRENAEIQVDEAARTKAAKYGAKGDFVTGLNRKAGEMDLADRMRRGTRGMERGKDGYLEMV